ncbi:questin oxidase family protein [Nocardioides salsibiostraticola]
MTYDVLDDAYDRLRLTGPEFDGWLSNHGPMAAEALARHGHEDEISSWLDGYARRLEAVPGSSRRIDDWRSALGDPRRLGDWLAWFEEQLREESWTDVLRTWWPRLLPGIAAGATHGVIRVGHAVRVLREEGETPARVAELAQGLGYWAARWQRVPGATGPGGLLDAESAVGWPQARRAIAAPADWEGFLRDLVTAAVRRYATHAHGNPVMLVHAATAPNAVLRVLPSLPAEHWSASASAAWSASAAVHAAYSPTAGRPYPSAPATAADAFDRASRHGDEHVIKLADTALDAFSWTGDDIALSAVARAADAIDVE